MSNKINHNSWCQIPAINSREIDNGKYKSKVWRRWCDDGKEFKDESKRRRLGFRVIERSEGRRQQQLGTTET